MGSPSKKAILYFLRSIKSWFLGKSLNVFEPFPVAMTFTWGKPLLRSCWVLAIFGGQWGLRIRSCQGSDSRLFFPTDLQRLRDKPPFYTAFPNNKNFEAHAEAGNCCDLWSVASGHRLHLPSGRGSRENRRENQADGRWKTCFPYENSQVNRVIIVCWHDCCFHR